MEDLFLVFSQFRDTVDISLNKFAPKLEIFKPLEFF